MVVPETFYCDAVCCIDLWNNVAVIDVAGALDVERMRQTGAAYRALHARFPHVVGLCVHRATAPMPASDARAVGAEVVQGLGRVLEHVAMVSESKGVLSQLFRSVMRSFNTMTRNKSVSFYDNMADATLALLPYVRCNSGPACTLEDLREAVAISRSRFDKLKLAS